ncbi:protein hinderin isoform X2 [Gadus chalcogrammus]|uniref:protein hinderin isoform X2 n=1 Tax=Gadus chalcogrammus TaxID=1042646 RepID=UPI0024C4D87B|nr:protein hinderin isoform X2 [Gadus chalcogrammus]
MAAALTRTEESGIFWINDTSEEEQSVVLVPVSRDTKFGIARSSEKDTKIRDKRDCKKSTKIERRQSQLQSAPSLTFKAQDLIQPHTAFTMTTPANKVTPLSQTNTTRTQSSLKDLCPEDKRRIANLIEELARVSEEKDESVQRLREEQQTFERKIQQLEQQNVLIIQEREGLQQQYKECQELLGLYQQYLAQQQEKLNQSIAQLHNKVSVSEATPGRPSGSRTNGSTLDASHPGPDPGPKGPPRTRRRDSGGTREALARGRQTLSDTTPPDSSSSCESGPPHVRTEPRRARRVCGHCPASGTKPRTEREEDQRLEHGGPQACNGPSEAEAAAPHGGRAARTDPPRDHEHWEEKRHQLLLQKLQLEAEKERLQTRLAEQEERLARQGQQLRQSRLDYSRFQQATQAQPSCSITGGGASQSEQPSNRHLYFGGCEDADAAKHLLSKDLPPTSANALQKELSMHEALRCSRQDMATSPVTTFAPIPEAIPACALPLKSPEARSDSSLLELLEVFSPIPVPPQRPPSFQRHNATVPHGALRPGTAMAASRSACLAPLSSSASSGRFTQSPQQDLEESQILEDIFFIC